MRDKQTPTVERLDDYLFDRRAASEEDARLGARIGESAPFRELVESNRDKVRKNLRRASKAQARGDVLLELATARRQLTDRRISTALEAYGSPKRLPNEEGRRPLPEGALAACRRALGGTLG
jgi:hypothetical protein